MCRSNPDNRFAPLAPHLREKIMSALAAGILGAFATFIVLAMGKVAIETQDERAIRARILPLAALLGQRRCFKQNKTGGNTGTGAIYAYTRMGDHQVTMWVNPNDNVLEVVAPTYTADMIRHWLESFVSNGRVPEPVRLVTFAAMIQVPTSSA